MVTLSKLRARLEQRLTAIYGSPPEPGLLDILQDSIERTKAELKVSGKDKWSERDAILITYGDSIQSPDVPPLQTLLRFLTDHLADIVSMVHILPFFPYSSDDGFSVIDYRQVNPALGTWPDIERIARRFKLMADLVINHVSAHSPWFKDFLEGNDPGQDYFIEVDHETDLSRVVRPRSLPLLTAVNTSAGRKHVWTTFSADQIDLNFANPRVLLEMLEILLGYLKRGVKTVRLDAIAFLWKEIGTTCLHLRQTHEVVKLMRDVMTYLADDLILLTETNVPNEENLSYFGNDDEAHMVYQFSLPPLLLHALFTGNSVYLTKWATGLPSLSDECTFLNFTASHDGIGVRPLEGVIPDAEFRKLAEGMRGFGAHISTKRNSDGSDSAYEINITYYDACKGTHSGTDAFQVARFLCAQTIMMTLAGIPAFYIHSLLGTENDTEGVRRTGMPRSINRKKWEEETLVALLGEETHHARVFNELRRIIEIRTTNKAFHPNAGQQILNIGPGFFAVGRGDHTDLISISNVTRHPQTVSLAALPQPRVHDLLTMSAITIDKGETTLQPYQTLWLVGQS